MARRLPKILVTVQDPGSANVTAQVATRLMSDGKVVLSVLCFKFARDVFRRLGVPFKELHDFGLRQASPAAAERILAMEAPDMLLVGTNEEIQSLERGLTVIAKARGIPVISLLDYWCNYTQRFSGESPDGRFLYLPDLIFIMDERAKDDMLAEGFPPERLFVTGHPYLEGYVAQTRILPGRERTRFRKALRIPDHRCLITFASETFGWTYDSSYRFPLISGSRERTIIVLEHVLRVLSEIVQETGLKIFLLNKLHPKNRLDQFHWIRDLDLPFPVRSVKRMDNPALIQSSRLVVGMTSMFLLEASALGIPTLQIVPREVEERILGASADPRLIARNPGELRISLRNLLENGRFNDSQILECQEFMNHRGATRCATEKLYEILGILHSASPGP